VGRFTQRVKVSDDHPYRIEFASEDRYVFLLSQTTSPESFLEHELIRLPDQE
jgi:hypothetical protein